MMSLYQARSGARVKVGITSLLDNRVAAYRSHNPSVEIVVKRSGLNDDAARFIEQYAHFVLCAKPGDEWVDASDEQVDAAITVAEECRKNLEIAQFKYTVERLFDYCKVREPGQVIEEARAAGLLREFNRVVGWLSEYYRLCKEHSDS